MEGTITTVSKKLDTDKAKIYSKSVNFFDDLKITAFIVDVLKGLIASAVKVSTTSLIKCINIDDEVREIVAITVAGFILLVIITGKTISKCVDDEKRVPSSNISWEKCWYILSNILMLLAVLSYFVGDNLKNFYKIEERPKRIRMSSQFLLIFGVLGFKCIPIFKGYIYKYYNRDVNPKTIDKKTKKSINCCINNTKACIDKTNDCIYELKGWTNKRCDCKGLDERLIKDVTRRSVALVPEADAIYSILENIFTNCSTNQEIVTWFATLAIPLALTPYICIQLFTVTSKTEKKCCLPFWMTVLSFMMVTSFILSDNQKVLNCLGLTKCARINDMNELNALNVTCNTTHISDDLFNSTSNQIVIGTECKVNSKVRIGLNVFQIVTAGALGITILFSKRAAKDESNK